MVPLGSQDGGWWDHDTVQFHGEGSRFWCMQRIREIDRVVVIHSDQYWLSPFCMDEFGQVVDSFTDRTEKLADVLVLVGHLRSGWGDSEALGGYIRQWDSLTSLPSMLQTETSEEKLRRSSTHLLQNRVPEPEPCRQIGRAGWIFLGKSFVVGK